MFMHDITSCGGGFVLWYIRRPKIHDTPLIENTITYSLCPTNNKKEELKESAYLSIKLVGWYHGDNVASFRVDVEHIGWRFIWLLSHDDVAQHSVVRVGIVCVVSRHGHHCSACQKQFENRWVIMETNEQDATRFGANYILKVLSVHRHHLYSHFSLNRRAKRNCNQSKPRLNGASGQTENTEEQSSTSKRLCSDSPNTVEFYIVLHLK